ncbi:hypothetical protein AJ80_07591 [Polytolypa hystricis UAMH7299]|uniref:Spindle pole body-associated protein cut12 domain-containing protein n=1 Tax=Polytolypa hystricis (strain UAMH7299) TaxID=1447883 RepID=A0A2B7XMI7_POLH7|nr:hypothetical protein AJ80_07591 [Polytolypa hystricis UAMH7299]
MLGWLGGSGRGQYTGFGDESKLAEAPETPGPVFAFRAFKSALLGTPGPVEDEEDLTVPIKPLTSAHNRAASELNLKRCAKPSTIETRATFPKPAEAPQPMASPTKSILLTPGTVATRRKTVSFGDGVVDNERKKSLLDINSDKDPLSGPITRQWGAEHAGGTRKNRSKLTQSLLDAREKKKIVDDDEFCNIIDWKENVSAQETSQPTKQEPTEIIEENDDDVTTNLEHPRSQSGNYWKSEYESYRAKTNREIKKLIQYRSVAKSYARKKEEEALRLAEKLKEEEAKVTEMERRVSELAAGVVGGTTGDEKEDMVKELSKQTALALQYKHKVDSLRKALERHGVVDAGGELYENKSPPDTITQRLYETKEALKQARTQQDRMKNQKSEMKELQNLAQSGELRASELRKENLTLKQTLNKVKEDIAKHEDRRKAKEARLKQRERKLETRIQDYRTRLNDLRQESQDAEKRLKASFEDEKKHMQETIDSLKLKISTMERTPYFRDDDTEYSPAKQYVAQNRDRVQNSTQGSRETSGGDGYRESKEGKRSPKKISPSDFTSPNKFDKSESRARVEKILHEKVRDHFEDEFTTDAFNPTLTEFTEGDLISFEDTPQKPNVRRDAALQNSTWASIPPSSPPFLPSEEPSLLDFPEKPTLKQNLAFRENPSPRPSMVYMASSPPKLADNARHHTHKSRSSLNPASVGVSLKNRQLQLIAEESEAATPSSPASVKLGALSEDRIAAAKARLKLKQQREAAKRERADGKENIWTLS